MVEMHDVGPEVLQQFDNVGNNPVKVDLAHVEAVEMTGPEQDFIAAIANALEACSRTGLAVHLVGGAHKHGFATGALIGTKQVVRKISVPPG